jgi:hypothetical protein
MDIQFAPGAHFPEQLQNIVDSCDLVLAVVGPNWRGAKQGRKRAIDNKFDPIRLEIETAFRAQKTLIPVLVGGAVMPAPEELPESLRNFSYLNAISISSGRDFHAHSDRLIRMIDGLESVKAHLRSLQSTKDLPPEQASNVVQKPAQHPKLTTAAKIVLSYRRADSSGVAGRLFDRIRDRFGAPNVFMDIDSIPFGTNFRTHIQNTLTGCKIVVALMGKDWIGKRLFPFQARIFDANDPIRLEMHTALKMNVPILPVLIDGAKVESMRLPRELVELRELHAAPLSSGQDFDQHTARLLTAIERHVGA